MQRKFKKSAGQSGEDGNSELRTKRLEVYVSPSEFEKLIQSKDATGHSTLARFLRARLLGTAESLKSAKKSNSEFAAITYEIGRIGNNLNQIAKRVNASKSDYFSLIEDLKSELDELRRIVKKRSLVKLPPEECSS